MAQGIGKHEPDAQSVYADIIDLPHWEPKTRKRMSLQDRAAQFAPFAALSGYEDMVLEEARETGSWMDLSEDETEELNLQLNRVNDAIARGEQPVCVITYFVPDPAKPGGEYVTVTEAVKRIDPVRQRIVLARRKEISGAHEEIDIARVTRILAESAP